MNRRFIALVCVSNARVDQAGFFFHFAEVLKVPGHEEGKRVELIHDFCLRVFNFMCPKLRDFVLSDLSSAIISSHKVVMPALTLESISAQTLGHLEKLAPPAGCRENKKDHSKVAWYGLSRDFLSRSLSRL